MSVKDVQTAMTWMIVMSIFGVILMFNVGYQDTSAEYYDTCKQLKIKFGNPDPSDCIKYINNNPNTTGQDIVDHFNVKLGDALLMKPTTDDTDPALKPKTQFHIFRFKTARKWFVGIFQGMSPACV